MIVICESIDVDFNECKLIFESDQYFVVSNEVQFEMDDGVVNDLNKLYVNC